MRLPGSTIPTRADAGTSSTKATNATNATKALLPAVLPAIGQQVLLQIAAGAWRPMVISLVVGGNATTPLYVSGWIFGIAGDRLQPLVRENRDGQFTPFYGVDGLIRADEIRYGNDVGQWKEQG
jgi:hypothetical protein